VCVTLTVTLYNVDTRLNISSSTLANFVGSRDSLLPSNLLLHYSCCQLHRSGSSSQQRSFCHPFCPTSFGSCPVFHNLLVVCPANEPSTNGNGHKRPSYE
jgi:hypothetical protein